MTTKRKSTRFGPRGNLIARGRDFEIYRYVRGLFQVIRLLGRDSPALLQELRRRVLSEKKSTAIDTYSLSEPGVPLIRELIMAARRLRNHGMHVVLVNARGKIRDLARALAGEDLIPIVVTETLLDGPPSSFPARVAAARRLLRNARSATQSEPAWRLIDRDGLWLCPYCGEIQDHIHFRARGTPVETTHELIVIHLLEDCEAYREKRGIRSLQELADRLKRVNLDKLMAAKESASALVSRVVELQDQVKEADELRHSVEIASERQRHLLPAHAPDLEGCLFGLGYRPSQRVSGDFYDFVELPGESLGLIIGDVSGHGIEAAILMGVAKKLINIRLRDTSDPLLALQMANKDLYPDMDRRTFVTAFVGVLDSERRTFSYARAGHNPVLLHNPGRDPDSMELEPRGMVLGMDSGTRFDQAILLETIGLEPGDLLFFYTDGLTEAKDPDGEEFGSNSILELVRAGYPSSPEDLIAGIYRKFDSFCQGLPQEDDVTMLAVKLTR